VTHSRLVATLFVVSLALLPLACGGGSSTPGVEVPPNPVSPKLIPVQDCADLDAYLVEAGVDRFVHLWEMGGYGMPMPMPEPGAMPPEGGREGDAAAGADAGGPTDYTETNVQEAGVDEVDLVKTDGQSIFVVQGSVLYIVKSWPAEETELLARVELEGWGGGLFLVGNRLVVLTSIFEGGYDWYEPGLPMPVDAGVGMRDGGIAPPEPMPEGEWEEPFQATRVTIFDVTDPAAPEVVRYFDIEGYQVGARLVDGFVYLVSMHDPSYYDPELLDDLAALDLPDPWGLTDNQRQQAAAEVRAKVTPVIADYVARRGRDRFLPDLRTQDGTRTNVLECTDIYRPERAMDLAMLSLLAFDPFSEAPPDGEGVIANGWQVYASQTALYISQDSRWWWWSDVEPRYAETHIHQFDLNDGSPAYRASGKVPGWILNQFSMSEREGYLRVATTDQTWNDWWWSPLPGTGGVVPPPEGDMPMPMAAAAPPRDANNVFVLAPEDTDLVMVGALRGLAPDEQIHAVRFLGDIGYVVTFRQVDPLFSVDLSDPTAPTLLGELHITGFSTYLHPMDADHLIGIGREATQTGRVLGLQLQLFDVSDPTDPMRTHQEVLSIGETTWSYSEAEHDHHAFTYDGLNGYLAIPVTLEDWSFPTEDYEHFSGLVVYHVTAENGFEELGRVSHTGLVREVVCSPEERMDPGVDFACDAYLYPWYAHMQRSIFIEGVLYAISSVGLTVSTIDAIDSPIVTIPFE